MSEFEKTTGEVNKILSDYKEMMNKVRVALREKMGYIFTAFFNTHPEVQTIHWTQYSPHFNDGEECIFRVHEPHFTYTNYTQLKSGEHVWGEGDDGIIITREWNSEKKKYVNTDIDPVLIRNMNELAVIIQTNEDIMRAMFNTSVWVKAHRDGFDIEDFEHG